MSNFRICVKRAKDGAKDGFKSEKRVGMSVIRSDTQRLYKLSVSLPAGQRAIVPGRLLPEQVPTDPGGRYRASFEFMQPTDGIDLMAGPWRVREQSMARANGGSVKLRTYFTPELDPNPGLPTLTSTTRGAISNATALRSEPMASRPGLTPSRCRRAAV